MNALVSRIEQSVNTLSEITVSGLDIKEFMKDKAYADTYTEEITDMVEDFAYQTEGTICAYVRYNPDYSNPTSGVFFTRDSVDAEFAAVTPTDFSMYDKSDTAHVGWYYIPVENKAPMWMSPYLNENINV